MTHKRPSLLRILLFAVCSYLISIGAILIGLGSEILYWLVFDSFGRKKKRAQRQLKWTDRQNNDEYFTIIVGAGFSGLGTAIKLNELGMRDYVILERHAHLGGTWYANQYPGCACDVPSNLYSFSFEPNPNWSHYFGRQPEIRQYLEHCADKYRVRSHIRFDTAVTQLKWLEERQLWEVTTESSEGEQVLRARSVVLGSGPLSNASFPADIEGMKTFEGQMCHTGEWDKTIDVRGKRVAVIGTGASAVQIVPEIQKMGLEQLLVFQRTPPWVIPRLDRPVTNFQKRVLARFPALQKLIRSCIYWSREALVLSFAYRWPLRHINECLVNVSLTQTVKDPVLREKLTPSWDLGCKRVLITSDWYPALQKPNVKLVTNRIREIKPHSIVTYDGDEYPVDILIFSTGFQTQKFGIPAYGVDGCSLADQWSDTMKAYRGMTVPKFPNLFILLGPNSRLGHSSVLIMLEAQLTYLMETFLYMSENKIRSVAVKQSAHDQYNQWLQAKLKKSVWYVGGCHSWYQDVKGTVTTIWPDFTWLFSFLLRKFDAKNYILRKEHAAS